MYVLAAAGDKNPMVPREARVFSYVAAMYNVRGTGGTAVLNTMRYIYRVMRTKYNIIRVTLLPSDVARYYIRRMHGAKKKNK